MDQLAYKRNVPVYVLSGGKSSRFGSDKALAEIEGRPMIARVADQWAAWTSRIIVVADQFAKYDALGLRTISDREPALGPMGGLLTALEDCGEGWLVLTACDTVMLDAELPQRLFGAITTGVAAVALLGEQWETMPALYHCSLLPLVRARVGGNDRALWRLIEQVPHQALPYAPDHQPLMHINTVEDWRRFQSARGA